MQSSPYLTSLVLSVFVSLLLGLLYAWLLYGLKSELPKRQKTWWFFLRSLVVGGISFLLFAPMIKRLSFKKERPIVVIATDNSQSVKAFQPKDFNEERYAEELENLKQKLSENYEVQTYSFGDSVKKGLFFDGDEPLSNATQFIKYLSDEMLNRNLGALILASDGIFNRGGDPRYELKRLNTKVYTLALGDTTIRKDVQVSSLQYNDLVYRGNDFVLTAELEAEACKGEEVMLQVFEGKTLLQEKKLTIGSSSFAKQVLFKLNAKSLGLHQYTVQAVPLVGEHNLKNNKQQAQIRVIDGKQNILLVSAFPHPDLATIKQAIAQNEHYELQVRIGEELDTLSLKNYQALVLYQMPAKSSTAVKLLSRLQQSSIPCWYILGLQSDLSAFARFQKHVNISIRSENQQEIYPVYNKDFSLFQLDSDSKLEQFALYPPLLFPSVNIQPSGIYSAALNQKIGHTASQNPLLFYGNGHDQKYAVLLGEGLWRWKLQEAKSEQSQALTYQLINRTIQYLLAKDDKRKFKVYGAKQLFFENEPVIIYANLYNDSYQATNEPELILVLRNAEGKVFNYTFSKRNDSYQLNLGALPAGQYRYEASCQLGDKSYRDNGFFEVMEQTAEFQQSRANHQLLYAMAAEKGGKMFFPDQMLQIVNELKQGQQLKTIVHEERRYEALIDLKWIFGAILALLTLEWFLRKRNGER